MSLETVDIPVPFASGVDTKSDEKTVEPGQLIELENGVFTRAGSIKKRYGYQSLGTKLEGGGQLPAAARLAVRDDKELLAFTKSALYSYLPDRDTWRKVDDILSVETSHEVISATPTNQTVPDVTELEGYRAIIWEDSRGGVYYSVQDISSGHLVIRPTEADSNGSRPAARAVGKNILLFWVNGSSLKSMRIHTNDVVGTHGSDKNSLTDLDSTDNFYDISSQSVSTSVGDRISIAWNTGSNIKVAYLDTAGDLVSFPSPAEISSSSDGPIAIHEDDTDIVVAWNSSPSYAFLDKDLNADTTQSVSGETSVHSLGIAVVDGAAKIVEETRPGSDPDKFIVRYYSGDGSATATKDFTQKGAGLSIRPWIDNGNVYCGIVYESTLYSTVFVQRNDGLIVSRMLPGLSTGTLPSSRHQLPNVIHDGATYKTVVGYNQRLDSDDDDVYAESGIRLAEFDFDSDSAHQYTTYGDGLYIGGMLQLYDGAQVVEANYHVAPDDVDSPTAKSDSGSIADGTYQYKITYEWTSAAGEIDISAPSVGAEVSVSNDDTVDVTIPTLRLTKKTGDRGECRIGVWRSEAGKSSNFFRVSSLDPTASGANGYVKNDPDSDTVTFTDKLSDSDLIKREKLYTNGGVLANDPVESGAVAVGGKDRIYYTDPSDPYLVRFSQQRREGYTVELTPFLEVQVDPVGGEITALAILDEQVIVFKKHHIYICAGEGPLANGTGEGHTPPQQVPSDVGCVNSSSIETTPSGVIFESEKGIHKLNRSLQVQYIGAAVEKYTDKHRDNQDIVNTSLIPDRREIRFLTDAGLTLSFDYEFNQWSTFSNHEGTSAAVVDGTYYYLRTDGEIWSEDNSHKDQNQQIRLKLRTAHLNLARRIQAFQRLWFANIIGEFRSPHKLRLRMFFDYEKAHSAEITLDPSEFIDLIYYGDGEYGDGSYGGDSVTLYQMEVHIGEQCETVQFEIADVEDPDDAGPSYELTEILLTGGIKGNRYHLSDSRKA